MKVIRYLKDYTVISSKKHPVIQSPWKLWLARFFGIPIEQRMRVSIKIELNNNWHRLVIGANYRDAAGNNWSIAAVSGGMNIPRTYTLQSTRDISCFSDLRLPLMMMGSPIHNNEFKTA